jgi:hypothetical protein
MKLTRLAFLLVAFATVAAAQPTPAKVALAREAIAAMQADQMFDAMAAQMKQMYSQAVPAPANATPEQRHKYEAIQTQIAQLTMEAAKDLIGKMDVVYAEVYSEAELTSMKAFFSSPEGRSMLAKQPQIMSRAMPLAQEMQRELGPKIEKLIQDMGAVK